MRERMLHIISSSAMLPLLFFLSCGKSSDTGSEKSGKDSVVFVNKIKAYKLSLKNDMDQAYQLLGQIEKYIDSSGYEKGRAEFYTNKARYFIIRGEQDSSLYYNEKAIPLAEKYNNLKIKAHAYGNIGTSLYRKGDVVGTIDYFIKADHIFEELNVKSDIATSSTNLGVIYTDIKDYEKAMAYHLKGLRLKEELKDTGGVALAHANIANIYYYKGDTKTALAELQKSYDMYKSINSVQGMGFSLSNIASIYKDLNKLDTALIFSFEALKLREQMQDQNGVAYIYSVISEIYSQQNKNAEALEYLMKSKAIGEKLGNIAEIAKTDLKLSRVYEAEKRYEEALSSYEEYIKFADSLISADKITEMNKKQMGLEFEKKEALNKKELEKQKLIRNGIIAGGILILILAFLMYRNYRNKKKANIELEKQKSIIEEKQHEILDSIQYAKQIQKALIANHEMVNQTIPDSFVFFQPKDIVSGDFYWATSVEAGEFKSSKLKVPGGASSELQTPNSKLFYLAVCDSTGHGVPGAFMSLLNISFLNEAIIEKQIIDPAAVFEHVRKRLIENISQSGRQDGMDGILICIDKTNGQITYSAANNPPLLVTPCRQKKATCCIFTQTAIPISSEEKKVKSSNTNNSKICYFRFTICQRKNNLSFSNADLKNGKGLLNRWMMYALLAYEFKTG
ncbi:MAG: hypothetical protein K0S12_2475 [Bacteroidetes bacterium]|nr:hypothetical protein [Bacteroidota bacterium]